MCVRWVMRISDSSNKTADAATPTATAFSDIYLFHVLLQSLLSLPRMPSGAPGVTPDVAAATRS